MIRFTTLGALAGALLLAAPAAAHASPFVPSNARIFCVPGAAERCFGMGWSSTDEVFSLYLQNLAGSYGGAPGFANISYVRVERINDGSSFPAEVLGIQEWDGSRTVGAVEHGTISTVLTQDSSAQTDADSENSRSWFSYGQGLIGCTYSIGEPDQFGVRTCPALGLTGWLVMDLRLQILSAPAFNPDVLTDFVRGAALRDFRLSIGEDGSTCDITGANSGLNPTVQECLSAPYTLAPITVTPEPATLALLIPGVAGVLAVRRRRRV